MTLQDINLSIQNLKDPDEWNRVNALIDVGNFARNGNSFGSDEGRVVQELLDCVQDVHGVIKREAARTLGDIVTKDER